MDNHWVHFILCLAPLLVVLPAAKLSLQLSGSEKTAGYLAAVLLGVAQVLDTGYGSGLLATTWLFYTIYLLLKQYRLWQRQPHPCRSSKLMQSAAFLYLCIGAAWALIDRLGWQPLGFTPLIVLLTAVHFHYAGFALPWIASKILPATRSLWQKRLAGSVIFGVPLTAVGITTSQLHWSPLLEVAAVAIMAAGAMMVAYLHLRLAIYSDQSARIRSLWALAALALMAGMSLALLYGLRYYFPISWLSIPWMYAVHGSLNSLGFALPAVVAWRWQEIWEDGQKLE